jgi:hypothetical protein
LTVQPFRDGMRQVYKTLLLNHLERAFNEKTKLEMMTKLRKTIWTLPGELNDALRKEYIEGIQAINNSSKDMLCGMNVMSNDELHEFLIRNEACVFQHCFDELKKVFLSEFHSVVLYRMILQKA